MLTCSGRNRVVNNCVVIAAGETLCGADECCKVAAVTSDICEW